jgi:SAM-dependent methyltransferase
MRADQCLDRLIQYPEIETILDIGSGSGEHAQLMRNHGKKVTTISLKQPADIIGDYSNLVVEKVDAIWLSHVLEHVLNPHFFLQKCFHDLNENGILAVTVPPLKHNVVGGHVNLFNAGILLYRLILAGFNCKRARVGTYGYNTSVLVVKEPINLPQLSMDQGDIEKLKEFFPIDVGQGFDGRIQNINW